MLEHGTVHRVKALQGGSSHFRLERVTNPDAC